MNYNKLVWFFSSERPIFPTDEMEVQSPRVQEEEDDDESVGTD